MQTDPQAFEVVLAIVALLAMIGIGIFTIKALMRPWVVLLVVGVLGWLLYFQTQM